ncbi:MAG: DUF3846 domain-containing protein [Clostridia bacterium]|nr:DUF3846 domain-containing protein [Clostridia bacterium]
MQNEDNKITVLVVPPLKEPYIKEIDTGLESLQKEVGGNIEVTYPFDDNVGIICNEEGKINGMELNRALYDDNGKMYDIIAGTFLVAGLGDENFISLTKEQTDKFSKRFQTPETFMSLDGEIIAVPVKPSVKDKLQRMTENRKDQAKPPRKPPDIDGR